MRREYLELHPWCDICGKSSQVIDHQEPHRGNERLFWDQANWRPLCKPCHDRKTAKADGGFGNRLQEEGPGQACGEDGVPLDPDHPWHRGGRGQGDGEP